MRKLAIAGGLAGLLLSGTAFASVIDRPFFKVTGAVVVWGATNFDETAGVAPVVSDFVLLTPASGTAGADLISTDVYTVVTGSLDPISNVGDTSSGASSVTPVVGQTSGGIFTDNGSTGILDAADALTAFGVDATNTDVGDGLVGAHKSSFYVASNAAFDIFAQTSNVIATGDFSTASMDESNISFEMDIVVAGNDGLAFGANAQDPSGASGVVASIDSLDDLSTQAKVFDGGQRTAASRGSLAEQSVKFDLTYELDSDTATAGIQDYDLSLGVGTLQADVTYTIFVP